MADTDRDQEQRRKECLRKSGTLLSQRDYTCMRLRDKLLAGGFEEEIVEMTLKDLKEAHYLDDERYARNFIQAHWEDRSRTRIRMDLENRGVPSDIAARVIGEENEERGNRAEIRQVLKLMQKRNFDPQSASWEEKGKMKGYLYRKGYSASSVRAAMNSDSLDSEEFSV